MGFIRVWGRQGDGERCPLSVFNDTFSQEETPDPQPDVPMRKEEWEFLSPTPYNSALFVTSSQEETPDPQPDALMRKEEGDILSLTPYESPLAAFFRIHCRALHSSKIERSDQERRSLDSSRREPNTKQKFSGRICHIYKNKCSDQERRSLDSSIREPNFQQKSLLSSDFPLFWSLSNTVQLNTERKINPSKGEQFDPFNSFLSDWLACTHSCIIIIVVSSGELQPVSKDRFKHGINLKATKLVLWICGDVERNPGPGNSRSEILRRFRKSQQTRILKMLHEFNGSKTSKFLYREKPKWWPQDAPFVNISNHSGESECKKCFDTLVDLLLHHKSTIPVDFESVLICFKDLNNSDCKTKQASGSRTREVECKEALVAWMGIKNTEKVLCTKTTSYYDDVRGTLCILREQKKQGLPIPEDIKEMCREIASTESEVPEDSRSSHMDGGLLQEDSRLSRKHSCLCQKDIHSSGMGKRKDSFKDTEFAASKKPKIDSIDSDSIFPLQEHDMHVHKVPVTSAVESSSFEQNKEYTRISPDCSTDVSDIFPHSIGIPLPAYPFDLNQTEGTLLSTQTQEDSHGEMDVFLDFVLTSGGSAVLQTPVQGSDYD